jgi:hypothetical protein
MRRQHLAVALAAAIVLSACGPKVPLRLDLRAVSISTPRVLTPAVQLVPVADAPPPVSLPTAPPVQALLPTAPPTSAPSRSQTPAAAPACPKASSLAVPARPATEIVSAPPAPDQSTQTSAGGFVTSGAVGSLAGSVKVVTTALSSATTAVGQKVDMWQVQRTDQARGATSVEVYQLVYPSAAAGATSGGIYLVALAWTDPSRGTVTFQPAGNGLWILPSPVQIAQAGSIQYVGTATDPATLTTLALTRNVTGRKRVDACGEVIDTFTVEMMGTLTTPDSTRQVTWTQQLATAYGAADVEETLSLTSSVDGFAWTRTLRNTSAPKEHS